MASCDDYGSSGPPHFEWIFPSDGNRLLLLLERLGLFNCNLSKAAAEEGCDEFYPLEIKYVDAQLDLAIFVPNEKKAGYKKKVAVGAVTQIPSMAKKSAQGKRGVGEQGGGEGHHFELLRQGIKGRGNTPQTSRRKRKAQCRKVSTRWALLSL